MEKTSRVLIMAWLVLSGTAGSPTPCVAEALVTLRPDAEVSRPSVRLSDLFDGVPAGIDRDIAQGPAACKPAVYDDAVLTKLAQMYRLDWQAKAGDRLVVSSPCSRISGDKIREAIVAKLKAEGRDRKFNYDVALDKRSSELLVPADNATAFTLENFSYDASSKQIRADVAVETQRAPLFYPIAGRISVKRSVPVLARRLESGMTLGERDLDWIEIPEERITADIITEPSQLIGREMRRDTPEGEILRSRDVMPARLVQRGSLVVMKIETPFMLITAQGKAEQDGTEGETIRIKNTQSNRIIEGVVTAPGVVEIRTTRKVALAE
jgi:flagella basal body P-ring formation protein FlgA